MRKIEYINDINPQILFDKIKGSIKKVENDEIQINGFDIKRLLPLTKIVIKKNKKIEHQILEIAIEKSVYRSIRENKLNRDQFLEVIEEEVKNLEKLQTSQFFLLGTLLIENIPFKKLKINELEISFYKRNYPKIFDKSRKLYLEKHKLGPDIQKGIKFSIKINARLNSIAFEKAFESLEVFRGLSNLLINPEYQLNFPEKSRISINKIRLGKVLTLHMDNGEINNENFGWVTDEFKEDYFYNLKDEEYHYLKKVLKARISLFNTAKPNYRKSLTKAMNLYAKAYDLPNPESTFMNAWTVIEILTHSFQNEKIISRILNLCHMDEKGFSKIKLTGLRDIRNGYVHEGNSSFDFQSSCFLAQNYIHILIFYFHLVLTSEFNSMDEAAQYLDLIKDSNIGLLRNGRLKKNFIRKL